MNELEKIDKIIGMYIPPNTGFDLLSMSMALNNLLFDSIAAARNENIMALDKKVTENFNKALKDESSDLVKMIQNEVRLDELSRLPIRKKKDFTLFALGFNTAKDELIAYKEARLKELK